MPKDRGDDRKNPEPVRSDFEGDPAMRSLIDLFVSQMPEKASRLSDLFEGGHIDDLERLAHQLRGAAGGYGFGEISEAAAGLEDACRAEEELDGLRSQVDELVDLCQRARTGTEH